jgi:hypothetical protein
MQTKYNLTHSIFDANIAINETQNAVSYCKLSKYSSQGVPSQHAFLLIQEPNAIYRKEIGVADGICKVKENTRFLIKDSYVERQVKSILWGDENSEYEIDKEVGHKTWAISSEKVSELFASIKLDIINKIPYEVVGDTSVFKPKELKERQQRSGYASYFGLAAGSLITGIMGAPIVPGSVAIGPAIGAGVFVGTIVGTSALASTAVFCMPTDVAKFKAHNCATWCVEKLSKLNIPEITKDLEITYSDLCVYVTGLHIPANENDRVDTVDLVKGAVSNAVSEKAGLGTTGKHVDAIHSIIDNTIGK